MIFQFTRRVFPALALAVSAGAPAARGQILISGGNYSQTFDALAASGTANAWSDNATLAGWYASTNNAGKSGSVTLYRADTGSSTTGALYSYGASGSTNRALGSLASGTPGNFAYGLRFTNDTACAQTNLAISYTGGQWRNGGNTSAQTLEFSYRVSSSPITNSDAANANTWTRFTSLDFTSPTTGTTAGALNGNNSTNQVVFTNVVLTGAVVQTGQEIFFRWFDTNDVGNDHALALDNLTVSFQATNGTSSSPTATPPAITAPPRNAAAGEGGFAIFSVSATGDPSPAYQWQCNGTNLPGATDSTLTLNGVTRGQAGNYVAVVTNSAGATNSAAATLLVMSNSFAATNGQLRVLQYNVAGNGATDWSTNAAQVQAIGRELVYFKPDIITFNEIPATNGTTQLTNWMAAFLPGYYLATNSFGDGYIQNAIASRFPITGSASHLHSANLNPFGYTNTASQNADNFTRDLFEAQIAVPNWPLPLHVFVAHLKSGSTQDSAGKRAAEAAAVSNYLAAVYLAGTNAAHPFILDGDLNEDAFFPETQNYTSGQPIQRLTGAATSLQMTIPVNPITRTDLTESIQGTLDTRFDYILPCAALFSNLVAGEVFRTDLLTNLPANLYSNDDKTASDHLPVLMVFNNPFNTPFRLLSCGWTNRTVTLQWETQSNRAYCIEGSSNLIAWTLFATNLATTGGISSFTTNTPDAAKFFRVYRAP